MQVDPQAAPVLITTPAGGGMSLDPGRQVVARVVSIDPSSGVQISLGGQTIAVASQGVDLKPGDTLSLTVGNVANGRLSLTLNGVQSAGADLPPPIASAQLSDLAPNAIRELARAGVPVTPALAQAVSKAVEQLTAAPGGPSTETAARAIANLVARDFALNPAAAGRVAAALDLAGRLGDELARLATQSRDIAASLPGGTPNAAALRSLVGSSLTPAELAVARIVQAQTAAQSAQAAAPGGPMTLPTPGGSSPAVIANYVASQVAVTTRLDALAAASTGSTVGGQKPPPTTQPAGQFVATNQAAAQIAANVRGEAALTGAAVRGEAPGALGSLAAQAAATLKTVTATNAANPAATNQAANANAVRPQAQSAASMAGAGAASGPTTSVPVSNVVADLSIAMTRFAAALAPTEGAMGTAAGALARQLSSADAQAAASNFTPQAAGGGANGAPAPLIAAMREALLGMNANEQQQLASTRTLLETMSRYDGSQIAAALRQLPESQTLQLAGRMLDLMPQGQAGMSQQGAAEMRAAIHNILHDLGRALQPGSSDDQAVLRAALQHVADNDPRPAVAEQAQRLLHAAEGQQVLSHVRGGADPGYVYFQLPLPGQRSAEVIVRREPGRREVTFDTFNIAFLLNTESIGTLMIHLDAHPGAVKAMIKTDRPALEPFLHGQAEAMREPVERESKRPLYISTGVFDNGVAPTSLLEPQLGMVPGENAYYA